MLNVFLSCILLCCSLGLFAQTVVKELKFDSLRPWQNQDTLKECVISDHPSAAKAWRMRSLKNAENKLIAGNVTTAPVKAGNYDRIVVDYDFKAVSPESRYALLAVGPNQERCITLIVDGDSYKVADPDGHWRESGKVTFGTWQHIRYIIYPLTGSFDIFVDDMKKPVIKNMEFRDRRPVEVFRFYSLGHPSVSSETYFTKMSIQFEPVKSIPPASLLRPPFLIGGMKVVAGTPVREDWEDAPVYPLISNAKLSEEGTCRLLRNRETLFARFEFASSGTHPKKERVSPDGKVWLEDSFQIFIAPDPAKTDYFHFAGNSDGVRYDARCSGGKRDASWNCDWKVKTGRTPDRWTADVEIPVSALGGLPGNGSFWRFNIGRENPGKREVSSWSGNNHFHDPVLWGRLYFFDGVWTDETAAAFAERYFQTVELRRNLTDLTAELKRSGCSEEVSSALSGIERKLQKTDVKYGASGHFYSSSQYARELNLLHRELMRLKQSSERMRRLFTQGSEAAERGCVVTVHSFLEKITPARYDGRGENRLELSLAGGEWGGGLVALLRNDGSDSVRSISIAADRLPPWLTVKIFTLTPVTMTVSGESSIPFLDILRPGSIAPVRKQEKLIVFGVDFQVRRGTSLQKYEGNLNIQLQPGRKISVPVKIQTAGFDLPVSRTLDTAFCFEDTWADEFYGREMTRPQKEKILRFIAEHHLEPMNLWGKEPDVGLDMIDYCSGSLGKKLLFLKITQPELNRKLIGKYGGKLRPILFGYDEILYTPERIPEMRKSYEEAARMFPLVGRLNTSQIDSRLVGAVSIWCPLFSKFHAGDAEKRKALGEKVWWYPTEGPRKPYPNFNLDSPGIDPRIIPWMNWKLKIDGLLYWALNREWRTNALEGKFLTDDEIRQRDLSWFTPVVRSGMNSGKMRFPQLPWLTYFRSISSGATSKEAGAGNLMYPGPDFEPWPSLRLKNLRDGLQDYEYFVLLKQNVGRLKQSGKAPELVKRAERALEISSSVVASATDYTKDPSVLLKAKKELTELILQTNKALQ